MTLILLFTVLYLKRQIEGLEFFWICSYVMLSENGAFTADLQFLTVFSHTKYFYNGEPFHEQISQNEICSLFVNCNSIKYCRFFARLNYNRNETH